MKIKDSSRVTIKAFYVFVTISLLFSCSKEPIVNLKDSTNLDADIKWWVLVHPSYGNSGIYLYNESKSIVEKRLPLPDPNGSPQALDFDGKSLWLGGGQSYHNDNGINTHNPIYELNPENGNIISTIENIKTEGIASSENYIYYTTYNEIKKIKKDGELVDSIQVDNVIISDLAIENLEIYYVFNGEIDPIIRINELSGEEEFLTETEVTGLYTLAIHNDNLVVVARNNYLRRFDKYTGEHLSDKKIEIQGWITAIAPYNKD